MFDFYYIDVDLFSVGYLFEVFTELVDADVLLPDDPAGELRMYGNLHLALRTLDNDFAYAAGFVFGLDVLADLVVLEYERRKLLFARVPLRVPFIDNADAQTVGIDFLTHDYSSSLVSSMTVMWLVRLRI